MKSSIITTSFMLCVIVVSASNLEEINKQLKKLCFRNPRNYINEPNVVKCPISYNASCWKETLAGQLAAQPCPFLSYSTEGIISRRCDEQGKWQELNISNCRSLEPREPADTGKQKSNVSHVIPQEDTLTHAERVQMVYIACNWIALFILLPTFILICVVMRGDNRFILHKNLILAFILRILTLFVYYYGKMEEDVSKKMVCNAFWMLHRFFAASEITWMLNEGIFLVRMLVYPMDDEFYVWYYLLFGWGFSGFLTFCVYLPYLQFKLARVSERCWVSHSGTTHILVLYVPLTIILLINFGFAIYVVRMLSKKLKRSQTRHMNTIKKSAKAAVILIFILGLIDLLAFYQPENNPGYEYFVAVLYPLQGIMVCIFFVCLSAEFRESLRRKWMKWRYGILLETNPYLARHDVEPGPSGVQSTSASVLRIESSDDIPFAARSIASLQDASRPPSAQLSRQFPDKPKKRNSQKSLLSRSSDLTKYRIAKVKPEPVKPVRVQSAAPEAWCPPTLNAVTAWEGVKLSENKDEPPTPGNGLENQGFAAATEGNVFAVLGSQISLRPKTTSTELEANVSEGPSSNTTFEETTDSLTQNSQHTFSSQLLAHDTRLLTAAKTSSPTGEVTKDNMTPTSQDTFSFSSQLFSDDTRPSTAGFSEEPTVVGTSICQDAELSTSTDDSRRSSVSFWHKAEKLATQRRRSRAEQGKVMSTEDDLKRFHRKYEKKQKDAEEYRMAWIAKILKGEKSHENESDA